MSVIIILDVLNFSADQNSISCFYGWFSTLTVFFSELPKDSKCGFFNDHIPYKRLSYLNQEYYKGNHRHMHSIIIVNYFLISYNYYMCT
jgi:hypothetical protein